MRKDKVQKKEGKGERQLEVFNRKKEGNREQKKELKRGGEIGKI